MELTVSVKEISWNQTVFSVMRTTTHLTYATFNVSHRTTHLARQLYDMAWLQERRVVLQSQHNEASTHYTCDPQSGNIVCLEGYTDPLTFCVNNEGDETHRKFISFLLHNLFYHYNADGGSTATTVGAG